MRFSAFIETRLEDIIVEWKHFARTISPHTETMSELALEDHAREMLRAIARDMETRQSSQERFEKSVGRAGVPFDAPETAAYTHGVMRQLAGFELGHLVSEFRALRASVLALWREAEGGGTREAAVEEIARFNEGIDQALAESVKSYAAEVARSRDMFLAVLGHDVRGPLSGISMAADLLALPVLSDAVRLQTALRIRRASGVIGRLTTDLLEYARSRLGGGIPVERADCNLQELCEQAIELVKAAHPEQAIHLERSGDLRTLCDPARMQQVLGNLLNNAVQHGDTSRPIVVTATREPGAIVLAVANQGRPVPPDAIGQIFEPLFRLPPKRDETFEQRSRVGLGLFIVKQIVESHGGTVGAESLDEKTVFTVRLPA
jgi:signal transduction histidine kinase